MPHLSQDFLPSFYISSIFFQEDISFGSHILEMSFTKYQEGL